MDKIAFPIVLILIIFCCGTLIAEEITLMSYYPVPTGNYNNLKAKHMWIGEEPSTGNLLSGGNAILQVGRTVDFSSGETCAIFGYSISTSTSDGFGIFGRGDGDRGVGVNGYSERFRGISGRSISGIGVYGQSDFSNGVRGGSLSGVGVYGESGTSLGVEGISTGSAGVRGYSSGNSDSSYGVVGSSDNYFGVGGISQNLGNNNDVAGVLGFCSNNSSGSGVRGESGHIGVYAECSQTVAGSYGLYATGGQYAGYFEGTRGVHAYATSSDNGTYGIFARGGQYAGYFVGDVLISGNLTVPRINGDHADIAEVYNLKNKEDIELGDVVVIDTENPNTLKKSDIPYSTNVAGIISGPDQAFIVMGKKEGMLDDKPLALVGRVLCKVTTENGPIKPGDLLVTSSTPGHAMKTEPIGELNGYPVYPHGCIMGKALEPLDEGTGKILVLLCL